jgi:hypothetical protein
MQELLPNILIKFNIEVLFVIPRKLKNDKQEKGINITCVVFALPKILNLQLL